MFEKGTETGSEAYSSYQVDESFVKYYRVSNIDGDCSTYVDKQNYRLIFTSPENVIVTFDGSVGKLGIGLEGAFSSGLQKIYDPTNQIANSIIWQIFSDERIKMTINKYATGSVLKHASRAIDYLEIPYQKEVYASFQDVISPMYDMIIKNKRQNNELVSLRDFLLPLLMNGQVRINEHVNVGIVFSSYPK
jgi:type I restriction enzyme S subunit